MILKRSSILLLCFLLTACGSTFEERLFSGAAIGAGAGAVIGAVSGDGAGKGAAVGAGAGMIGGMATY